MYKEKPYQRGSCGRRIKEKKRKNYPLRYLYHLAALPVYGVYDVGVLGSGV
jgi:hypothetical protein